MYLMGRVTIDLRGATVVLSPPANFFGGVAHLITSRRWDTQEQMETYKLLSFAQSANRALMDLDVKDVLRVSVGDEVIYEDFQKRPDDFEAAMDALEERLSRGYEPNPLSEFDLVFRHDDGVLSYVIDLDFLREHAIGVDPVAITVAAVLRQLRRGEDEDIEAFMRRVGPYFASHKVFDDELDRWSEQLQGFLNEVANHFRSKLGISRVHTQVVKVLPRRRDAEALATYTAFGRPLYGFSPDTDLAYLLLWDSLWRDVGPPRLRRSDYYDYDDWGYVYVGAIGLSSRESAAPDIPAGAPVQETPFPAELESFPGSTSDGGWLSHIGDFFRSREGGWSGEGGDGGGGDGGGGDGGGGGGCGGGGCGGGGD